MGLLIDLRCPRWLSDPDTELYTAVREQLVEPCNVKLLVKIGATCYALPEGLTPSDLDLAGAAVFPISPYWISKADPSAKYIDLTEEEERSHMNDSYRSTLRSQHAVVRLKVAHKLLAVPIKNIYQHASNGQSTILNRGSVDAMVLVGLLVWLPREVVQRHTPAAHRDEIISAVSNWCEDFPTINAIRAEVLPGSALRRETAGKRDYDCAAPLTDLQRYAMKSARRQSEPHGWDDVLSSAIPDVMLLKISMGLTANFVPAPVRHEHEDPRTSQKFVRYTTPEVTQQLVDLMFGRTRCLSYHIAPGDIWRPAGVEDNFESMRKEADKTLMDCCRNLINEDLKGIIKIRP